MATAQKADTDGYLYFYRHYLEGEQVWFWKEMNSKIKERINIWQNQTTKNEMLFTFTTFSSKFHSSCYQTITNTDPSQNTISKSCVMQKDQHPQPPS